MTKKDILAHVLRDLDAESPEDRKQFRRLASSIRQSKWKEAAKRLRDMDSFNREAVSDDVTTQIKSRAVGSKLVVTAHVKLKDCKTIFKEGFKPGVVMTVDLEFPGDADETHIAFGVANSESSIIAQAVEVKYSGPKKVEL